MEWNEEKVREYVKAGWTLTFDKSRNRFKLTKRIKGKFKQFNLPRELNAFCRKLKDTGDNGDNATEKAEDAPGEREKHIVLSDETLSLLEEFAEMEGVSLQRAAEIAIIRGLNSGETLILGKGVNPYVQLIFKALKRGCDTPEAIIGWLITQGFIRKEHSGYIKRKLKDLESEGYIGIRGVIKKRIELKKEIQTDGKVIIKKGEAPRLQAILKRLRKGECREDELANFLANDYGWASEEEARKLIRRLVDEGVLVSDGNLIKAP